MRMRPSHTGTRSGAQEESLEDLLGFSSGHSHNQNLMEIFGHMRRQTSAMDGSNAN